MVRSKVMIGGSETGHFKTGDIGYVDNGLLFITGRSGYVINRSGEKISPLDIEKVIETVVYQHLVRLGYQVFVGELRVGEIDFVCKKPNQVKYVQVSYLINDDETRKREFGRLADIKDNYPKYVISLTPLVTSRDYDGITHIGLREFLKNGL